MINISFIIIFSFISIIHNQSINIQNLKNNNGYVTIKINEFYTIEKFSKILHIINITEYQKTRDVIYNNIEIIRSKSELISPMFDTLIHNFNLLNRSINNLTPHTRSKRALINILGTGLKYIAGTMDSNDEQEIKNKLDALTENNRNLIEETNKQIKINNEISQQIINSTNFINNQQNNITFYLTNFYKSYESRIAEDKILYAQCVYQINYDKNLLKTHIDDIEQIILTSKSDILSKNILTEDELNLIQNLEVLKDIKIVVDQIIIIIFIPTYSSTLLSKILIEPVPNPILLDEYEILLDSKNNNLYYTCVKENLEKNLISIQLIIALILL